MGSLASALNITRDHLWPKDTVIRRRTSSSYITIGHLYILTKDKPILETTVHITNDARLEDSFDGYNFDLVYNLKGINNYYPLF